MRALKRLRRVATIIFLGATLAATVRAGDAPPEDKPSDDKTVEDKTFAARAFVSEIQPGATPGWEQIRRVIVRCETNEFALIIPNELRINAGTDKLTFSAPNASYFLTVRVINSNVGETTADTTRPHVTRQYPQTRIVDEFSKSAAGRVGPVFSLRGKVAGEIDRAVRVGLIPCCAGIMEITYNAEPSKSAQAEKAFNALLRTFRSNEKGKLDTVIRVLDKS